MFFTLAIISAVCYALQSALLSKYSRSIGGPSTSLYRGLSISISVTILLPFIPLEVWSEALNNWKILLLAGITSGSASLIAYSSLQYSPIGIANSITRSITIIATIILSFLVFKETLSSIQSFFIFIVGLSVIILGVTKKDFEHLDTKKNEKKVVSKK